MNPIPHEFTIGGVYLPPLLIASILGALAAWLSVMLLNRYRLSRFLYYPPLIFVALVVIYTVLIGTFVIPV
jgi:LytS/YehU family sensor histidine kinase